jgi:hypothetical protein
MKLQDAKFVGQPTTMIYCILATSLFSTKSTFRVLLSHKITGELPLPLATGPAQAFGLERVHRLYGEMLLTTDRIRSQSFWALRRQPTNVAIGGIIIGHAFAITTSSFGSIRHWRRISQRHASTPRRASGHSKAPEQRLPEWSHV